MITLRTEPGDAERALFFGVTRSGKTTMMRELCAPLHSVVVFDTKQLPRDWVDWGRQRGYVVTGDPADVRRHEKVILEVDTRWIDDRAGWAKPGSMGWSWTEALGSVFYRLDGESTTVVIFDEAMQSLGLNPHPDARRLFTSGAGLGGPCWLGSQAPNYVDPTCLAMAEHCFAFSMANGEFRTILRRRRGVDCEVLAELAGPDDPDLRRRREWAHHFTGAPGWETFAPLKLRTTRRVSAAAPLPGVRLDDTVVSLQPEPV